MRWLVRVAMMLLVTELVIRAILHVPWVRERAVRLPGLDTSAELSWYLRRAEAWREGRLRHPERPWAHAVWDAQLGWLPAPGEEGVVGGERGPTPARPPDATRIVVVGDSFAYGLEVRPAQTFSAVLEARREDVDLINLGVPGYGHDQILLRTARDVAARAPDIVLLPAIGIDVPRAAARFVAYAKPRLALPDLAVVSTPVPQPPELSRRILLRPRLLDLASLVVERRQWADRVDGEGRQAVHALVGSILDRWVVEVRAMGAEPVVVVLPTPDDLEAAAAGRDTTRDSNRLLYTGWCARQDFPCVDAHDRVRARVAQPADFRAGGHWSPEGHEAVASTIEEVLVDAGLIPAAP